MSAWLYLVAAPARSQVNGLDADGGIAVLEDLVIGRTQSCTIVVTAPMIGGRMNSRLRLEDGRWHYEHLGHGIPIFHNDEIIPGHSSRPAWLAEGDLLGPVAASRDGERITFVFLQHETGLVRSAALPSIERALDAAFPDRASELISGVRRWFASEPFASSETLSRVLHCDLCARFVRGDRIIEVERDPDRFQVIADSQARIGDAEYPSLRFCESCLASPEATLSCAENADRLRADVRRALLAAEADPAIGQEAERRCGIAQPTTAKGRCRLCGEERDPVLLSRSRQRVCLPCLRGASAIRHIRG